ncbi:uncharacterized protein LOC129586686 isoform X2 [Paramacrobiotus metropolitanus]|nr:uncharacterized protein LOC129586686 isoform X2 [Paramacrobiotus metropolitanus]
MPFAFDKTELMHFTCKRNVPTQSPVLFGQHTVHPVDKLKYLGIVFDPQLTWTHQVARATQNAYGRLSKLRPICKKYWGVNYHIMRRYYIGAVRPVLTYAAVAWCGIGKSLSAKINKVQRLAAVLITGAQNTSPTVALDVEAQLTPMNLHLLEVAAMSLYRLQTLKDMNIAHALVQYPEQQHLHKSPSSYIVQRLDAMGLKFPTNVVFSVQQVLPYVYASLRSRVIISALQASAVNHHIAAKRLLSTGHMLIYTDGSKQGDNVGAAVVVFTGQAVYRKEYRLPAHATVAQAELYAVHQALLYMGQSEVRRAFLYSDSKAVLDGISATIYGSPNKDIKEVQDCLLWLLSRGVEVTLQWIPAHIGIYGNEMADLAAKQGAHLPENGGLQLPLSKASFRQLLSTTISAEWQKNWSASQKGRALYNVQPNVSYSIWRKPVPVTRKMQGLLTQLRMDHSRLNASRPSQIYGNPSLCSCGFAPETTYHFFYHCSIYKHPSFTVLRSFLEHAGFTGLSFLNIKWLLPLLSKVLEFSNRFR